MSGEILNDDQHDGTEPEAIEEPVASDRKRTRLLIGGAAILAIAMATTVRNSPALASQVGQYLPASFVAASTSGHCGEACPLSLSEMATTPGHCASQQAAVASAAAESPCGSQCSSMASMSGSGCCSSQTSASLTSVDSPCGQSACSSAASCSDGVCPYATADESVLASDDRPIDVQLTSEL